MIFNFDVSETLKDVMNDTETAIATDPSSIDAIKNYDVGIYRVTISGTTVFPHGYGVLEILKAQDYGTARFSTINVSNPRTWRVEWNTNSGSWYNNVWTDEQKYVKDLTSQLPVANGGTGAITAADARTNLGLCYAANDTFSVTSSLVLCGIISSNRKNIYLDVPLDKSTVNISSVSVTAMTGYIVGINGRIESSNIDFTDASYSTSCLKQGDTHIRISISKSNAGTFFNSVEDTTATYFGALTLKFA